MDKLRIIQDITQGLYLFLLLFFFIPSSLCLSMVMYLASYKSEVIDTLFKTLHCTFHIDSSRSY